MIGTDGDIERRLQEQLEGPKALFVDEERVCLPLPASMTATDQVVDPRTGTAASCLYCRLERPWCCHVARWKVRFANGYDKRDQ
jgi:hypothetical protein